MADQIQPQLGDTTAANNFIDLITTLKLANQNMSQLVNQMLTRFGAQSAIRASYGIVNSTAGGTLVYTGAGYLTTLSITTASTGTVIGTVYDSNTVVGVGSSVAIGIIPSSGLLRYDWPFANGLVVQPSSVSTQAVSVSYIPNVTPVRGSS